MHWTIYILKSQKKSSFYIGCTNNLERRFNEHNSGYVLSTRLNRPYDIVYQEVYLNQGEAFDREKKIKSYKGGNAFKKLIIK